MYSLQSLLNYFKCSWRVVEYFCDLSANLQIWSIINFFFNEKHIFNICCCFSVAKLCPTLCDLMNCGMPGFSLHNYLHEFAQIHVHWCHPTISSSVTPFSSFPQFFPASGSSLVSQLFALSGQSIGASASASVLPMNIQVWFPLWLTDLISL